MPLSFACPACAQPFTAPDNYGGTAFNCPRCKERIRAPEILTAIPEGIPINGPRRRRKPLEIAAWACMATGAFAVLILITALLERERLSRPPAAMIPAVAAVVQEPEPPR